MTGWLVDWLGRCLLHERTRALIVEPALADLAFESAPPRASRSPAWRGAWVALLLAVWHDLAWDPRGPAWGRSARVLGSLALVVASYHASMLTLMLGFDAKWRTGVSRQMAAAVSSQSAVLLAALVFAFGVVWAARHAHDADGPS